MFGQWIDFYNPPIEWVSSSYYFPGTELIDFYNPPADWISPTFDMGITESLSSGVTTIATTPSGPSLLSTITNLLKIVAQPAISILQASSGSDQSAPTQAAQKTTTGTQTVAYPGATIFSRIGYRTTDIRA